MEIDWYLLVPDNYGNRRRTAEAAWLKPKPKVNCLQLLYLIILFKYLVCIITIN